MSDERKPIALLPAATSSPLGWAEALRKASQLPPPANDGKIIIPTAEEYQRVTRGFIGPQQEMSKRKRRLRITAGVGNYTPSQPTHKRYIVKLKDKTTGKERVGKVITTLDIEEWAQKNNYRVLRSFRIYTYVNSEREFTELTE